MSTGPLIPQQGQRGGQTWGKFQIFLEGGGNIRVKGGKEQLTVIFLENPKRELEIKKDILEFF